MSCGWLRTRWISAISSIHQNSTLQSQFKCVFLREVVEITWSKPSKGVHVVIAVGQVHAALVERWTSNVYVARLGKFSHTHESRVTWGTHADWRLNFFLTALKISIILVQHFIVILGDSECFSILKEIRAAHVILLQLRLELALCAAAIACQKRVWLIETSDWRILKIGVERPVSFHSCCHYDLHQIQIIVSLFPFPR